MVRKFVSLAFVSAALLTVSGAAQAADIPMKAPIAKAVVAPAWSWNGWYIGAHAGYNWGRTTVTDRDGYNTAVGETWDFRTKGFVGGGQVGWNWHANPLLFGIEADLGYLDARGNGASPTGCRLFACDTVASTRSDFYATLRGRLGVTAGDALLYVTGGGIGINQRTTVADNCNLAACGPLVTNAEDRSFRLGWTAGGGIEWHIPGTQWSVKGEYLYYDIGGKTLTAPAFFPPIAAPVGTFRWDTKSTGSIARLGVNWHF